MTGERGKREDFRIKNKRQKSTKMKIKIFELRKVYGRGDYKFYSFHFRMQTPKDLPRLEGAHQPEFFVKNLILCFASVDCRKNETYNFSFRHFFSCAFAAFFSFAAAFLLSFFPAPFLLNYIIRFLQHSLNLSNSRTNIFMAHRFVKFKGSTLVKLWTEGIVYPSSSSESKWVYTGIFSRG